MDIFKRMVCGILAAALVTSLCVTGSGYVLSAESEDKIPDAVTKSDSESQTTEGEKAENTSLYSLISYSDYLDVNNGKKMNDNKIEIDALTYTNGSGVEKTTIENVEAVLVDEQGEIEWEIDLPTDALYNIMIEYYPVEGKGSTIERALFINGVIPFKEASNLMFTRMWKDKEAVRTDSSGNELRPRLAEHREWIKYIANDSSGYINEPLKFLLNKGKNTFKLTSVREPIAISRITFFQADEIEAYKNKINGVDSSDPAYSSGIALEPVQAEKYDYKSAITIYQLNDKTSAATMPQSAKVNKLNAIGSDKWQMPGQWISWTLDIKESGYYKIAPRFRQNIYSGGFTSRKMTINGEVPFKEAAALRFNYNSNWQLEFLGDEKNGDYIFYFEAGKYDLKLEVVLGDMAKLVSRVEKSLESLNEIYRKILMITGPTPDIYRDYGFPKLLKNELEMLNTQAVELSAISNELQSITGMKGEYTAVLNKLVYQLEQMYEKPERIANFFSDFKTNIGSLGTWILTARQQPLEIDYFNVVPASETKLPKAEATWYNNFWFGIKSFVQSFFRDYNAVAGVGDAGGEDGKNRVVKVWVSTGRDQAQIIRIMADDDFSVKHNAAVDLQLTDAGALLPATLAGMGPDVSISTDGSHPINFALRDGVMDLTKFPDFPEIAKRFHESTLVPFTYLNKTYALPETQTFPVMFYRKDIFDDLKLSVPKTWEDIYSIIPELKKNNMDIAFPIGMAGFQLMLYQRNGELYLNEGEKSNLDSDVALDAFQELCDLFNQYTFPVEYDFANRFRTGEMPLGIQDYTLYNQLTVFAPEIKGLWEFAPVPGYKTQSGEIINTVPSSGLAAMLMKKPKNETLSWEFLKWWTSAEIQGRFGQEMESVLGSSAKQPTANLEAVSMLPWTNNELKVLTEARKNAKGVPQYPGSYYTNRNVEFAFTKVYNNKEQPVDTMLSYIESINRELERKREEFGVR